MQPFELFYANVVDEFMILAKNYGQFFSMTYDSGEHREDYTFGLTLSVMYNKEHPETRTYQLRNAKGWNLGSFSGSNIIELQAWTGEMICHEFSRAKSIYYGTIAKDERYE